MLLRFPKVVWVLYFGRFSHTGNEHISFWNINPTKNMQNNKSWHPISSSLSRLNLVLHCIANQKNLSTKRWISRLALLNTVDWILVCCVSSRQKHFSFKKNDWILRFGIPICMRFGIPMQATFHKQITKHLKVWHPFAIRVAFWCALPHQRDMLSSTNMLEFKVWHPCAKHAWLIELCTV